MQKLMKCAASDAVFVNKSDHRGGSGELDFSENIQSGSVFYADFLATVVVGLLYLVVVVFRQDFDREFCCFTISVDREISLIRRSFLLHFYCECEIVLLYSCVSLL
jgi:hypothetical protein